VSAATDEVKDIMQAWDRRLVYFYIFSTSVQNWQSKNDYGKRLQLFARFAARNT
jgi:hypothetical protein